MFGDGVEAGVGQVNLASGVDPDAMRRGGQVPPTADLVPIPVEDQHVPDTAEDGADRAVLAGVADAGVDPAPCVDTDIRDGTADLYFGPMFHHFILVIAEPDALRHGAPPAVGEAHHGPCRTLPMPATLSAIDDLAPVEPDCWGAAGDDGTRDDAGPLPLGGHRRELSDRPALFLHGHAMGHPVVGVLPSPWVLPG